ncbi:MAG: alkaline phosphatase family protein [Polyangiaceae bacterium]
MEHSAPCGLRAPHRHRSRKCARHPRSHGAGRHRRRWPGFDSLRSHAAFDELRARGTLRPMRSHFPTYTAPNITAMFTGQTPRDSGIKLNAGSYPPGPRDSALRAAWDAGVYVQVRSRLLDDFQVLTHPPEQASVIGGRVAPIADLAWSQLGLEPTLPVGRSGTLTVIHFGEVDEVAHDHGVASAQYDDAVERAARFVERFVDGARAGDEVFAVSDHGHVQRGGHGGDEPVSSHAFFMAWGSNIRAGASLEERPLCDVASTITVALGAPTPSTNLCAPMLDTFDLEPEARAVHALEPFDQLTRASCERDFTKGCDDIEPTRALLSSGKPDEALALLGRLEAEREAHATASETRARRTRLAVGLTLSALLLTLGLRKEWRLERVRVAASVLACAIVPYVSVLLARGYRPTLSTMTGTRVFGPHAVQAALASLVIGWFVARRARWGSKHALFSVLSTLALLVPWWAYCGASSTEEPPATASAVVFLMSPLVPIGALAALGYLSFEWRRSRTAAGRAS